MEHFAELHQPSANCKRLVLSALIDAFVIVVPTEVFTVVVRAIIVDAVVVVVVNVVVAEVPNLIIYM